MFDCQPGTRLERSAFSIFEGICVFKDIQELKVTS